MSSDPNIPPCVFCEKKLRPLEPYFPTQMILLPNMIPPGMAPGAVTGTAPVHIGCFMKAIAGEVADAVLEGLEYGKTDVGLDKEPGLDLNEVVAGIVHRFAERARR